MTILNSYQIWYFSTHFQATQFSNLFRLLFSPLVCIFLSSSFSLFLIRWVCLWNFTLYLSNYYFRESNTLIVCEVLQIFNQINLSLSCDLVLAIVFKHYTHPIFYSITYFLPLIANFLNLLPLSFYLCGLFSPVNSGIWIRIRLLVLGCLLCRILKLWHS